LKISQKIKQVEILNPNKFKTDADEHGRVCTKCLSYKSWDNYFISSKTKTGYQSECKVCKKERRVGRRDIKREKYCAKKNKQRVKKENPVLYKARELRSRLLSRSKDPGIKQTTPTIPELEKWLTRGEYICYYSGAVLTLDTVTVDHKVPVSKGGSNELDNLCIASNHMNTAKGNLTAEEFMDLLLLIRKWNDQGEGLLRRLKQGWF
jgi:5-methylcytosine-specific restriction endonuclease McrA